MGDVEAMEKIFTQTSLKDDFHKMSYTTAKDRRELPMNWKLTLSLPCFSVQIKHKNCKNMNSVQQQREHHH